MSSGWRASSGMGSSSSLHQAVQGSMGGGGGRDSSIVHRPPDPSRTTLSADARPPPGFDKEQNAAPALSNEQVIGSGSFGVVFKATLVDSGETVAVKKVLQDRRFKNRELQIMKTLRHPNIVDLRGCFYSSGEKKDEVYLNLLLEFVPETVYKLIKHNHRTKRTIPMLLVKCYTYQLCRSLAYCHAKGVCHRDIKPQNLLLDSKSGIVKLCDFGSAKMLVQGEPNIAYICSRYYRAPELIFGSTTYSCSIDTWSLGCVLAEMLLGTPLFPGESNVDQLVEIIKIVGTPTRQEILLMNKHYNEFSFPQIKATSWSKVFRRCPPDAIDLVSQFLRYVPTKRLGLLQSLAHPFFDELRQPGCCLPNGRPLPPLFNFTPEEIEAAGPELMEKLMPQHAREAGGAGGARRSGSKR